jgi:hypothetical protein
MAVIRVGTLPGQALDAAAKFHGEVLTRVREALAESDEHLVLVFEPAGHEHRAWRLAVVQQLARDHAPLRVNALESGDEAAIAAAMDYVGSAPGLTGQLLRLDGNGVDALLCQTT